MLLPLKRFNFRVDQTDWAFSMGSMQHPDRPRHVTLKDVAEALGISLGTVSMSMRDDPRITEVRRQQVKETAREMGYRPNAMATALARF